MSTFDSLELGRVSDDGREVDERVAGMVISALFYFSTFTFLTPFSLSLSLTLLSPSILFFSLSPSLPPSLSLFLFYLFFALFLLLLSVLEFELRKAYETIKSLRGSLTRASDINTRPDEGETPKISDSTVSIVITCIMIDM